jgi:hypothetical protein
MQILINSESTEIEIKKQCNKAGPKVASESNREVYDRTKSAAYTAT